MSRPFQPPSTPEDTVTQLRNLHEKLTRFGNMSELTSASPLEDVVKKLNEFISLARAITAGGVGRRGK